MTVVIGKVEIGAPNSHGLQRDATHSSKLLEAAYGKATADAGAGRNPNARPGPGREEGVRPLIDPTALLPKLAPSKSNTGSRTAAVSEATPYETLVDMLLQYLDNMWLTDRILVHISNPSLPGRGPQSPEFIQFWSVIARLPLTVWHRWFDVERVETVAAASSSAEAQVVPNPSEVLVYLGEVRQSTSFCFLPGLNRLLHCIFALCRYLREPNTPRFKRGYLLSCTLEHSPVLKTAAHSVDGPI